MTEYQFAYSKDIPPGRVVFTLQNIGRENHGVTLLPLADDFPPIEEQLQGSVRRVVETQMDVEVRTGQSATFAVEFSKGRYAIVCFVQSPDGVSHSKKGMTSEFRVH